MSGYCMVEEKEVLVSSMRGLKGKQTQDNRQLERQSGYLMDYKNLNFRILSQFCLKAMKGDGREGNIDES